MNVRELSELNGSRIAESCHEGFDVLLELAQDVLKLLRRSYIVEANGGIDEFVITR
jgi:hypothetical protein